MICVQKQCRTGVIPSSPAFVNREIRLYPERSARKQWNKLSAPIERLIELGLLDPSQSVLDYGCGQGLDVQFLKERGFEVEGWDPYWSADGELVESDVGILNFVLDCIGDPGERAKALQQAWGLARNYLMVTVRRDRALVRVRPYSDGWLTRWGTFQRLFTQGEFYHLLRETLPGTLPIEFDRGGCVIIPKTEDWQERISNRLQPPGKWRSGLTPPHGSVSELTRRHRAEQRTAGASLRTRQ